MGPTTPQLQAAMRFIITVLNSDDNEALRTEVLRELEQRTGITARTTQQEAALRKLVQLADVKADQGLAEDVSLEDTKTQTCGTTPSSLSSERSLACRCADTKFTSSSRTATKAVAPRGNAVPCKYASITQPGLARGACRCLHVGGR